MTRNPIGSFTQPLFVGFAQHKYTDVRKYDVGIQYNRGGVYCINLRHEEDEETLERISKYLQKYVH